MFIIGQNSSLRLHYMSVPLLDPMVSNWIGIKY